MTTLVIGASSHLGSKIMSISPAIGTYNQNQVPRSFPCDLTQPSIAKIFQKVQPDTVIHLAGLTNVDYCQANQKIAKKINIDSTKYILQNCKKYNAKLIYTSTDAIFDGTDPPYTEISTPNPLNYYGVTKLESENLIKNSGISYIIARVMLMYGAKNHHHRENPFTYLMSQLSQNQPVKMVTDQYRNPILADDCAKIILELIEKNKEGTYHIASPSCISRYDFAITLAEVFNFDTKLIQPVTSDIFPELIPRAVNTCFGTRKILSELDTKARSAEKGLKSIKQQLFIT